MTPCRLPGCDFVAIDTQDAIEHMAECPHRKNKPVKAPE